MKRLLCAALLAVAFAATAHAAFFDFEQITVDNTSGGVKLTAAKVAVSLEYVLCKVRTAEISFLTVDPNAKTVTTTVGTLAEPGDQILITSREEALNLRAIRTGSTSGQLDCTYRTRQAP
jgi:hypothetical protein